MVHVDVEYCCATMLCDNCCPQPCNLIFSGSCGHSQQFQELKTVVLKRVPETKISGRVGRQASFEVEVNRTLVYSKLKTMAFPDYNEIADIVEETAFGSPIRKAIRQQPIHCSVM